LWTPPRPRASATHAARRRVFLFSASALATFSLVLGASLLALTTDACVPPYVAPVDGGVDGPLGRSDAADTTDGEGGRDAGDGAAADAGDAADAEAQAPPTEIVLLGDAGSVAAVTGNAQETHLVFATNSSRWWLFYIDDNVNVLETMSSPDLLTWTPGAALPLPVGNAGEGRNVSVAYQAFGTTDVLHIATSLLEGVSRSVYETRATVVGDAITFGTPIALPYTNNTSDADADDCGGPDGPSVAIGADGHVYVVTAWNNQESNCNSTVYTSTGIETGVSSITAFTTAAPQNYDVSNATFTHQILAFASNIMLVGWDSGDMTNVQWADETAGAWQSQNPLFMASTPQLANDWSMCRIDDDHVYAVRRRAAPTDGGDGPSSVYELAVWDSASSGWIPGTPPASDPGSPGNGVVLLAHGTTLLAAAIGTDLLGSVRYATYEGGTWSAWTNITTTSAARHYLAGSGCGDLAHPTLLWTEGTGAPYSIAGLPALSLFP
jgi:hypothetical protein